MNAANIVQSRRPPALARDPSCAFYWGGRQGAGHIIDESMHRNHGVVNGARLLQTDGVVAAVFDGVNDHIIVGSPPLIKGQSFTAWQWILCDDFTEARTSLTTGPKSQIIGTDNGHMDSYLKDSDGNSRSLGGSIAVDDGQWHFCVVRHDHYNKTELFTDNNLDDTGSVSFSAAIDGEQRLQLSGFYNGAKVYKLWSGYIATTGFVFDILPQSQLNRIMDATRPVGA